MSLFDVIKYPVDIRFRKEDLEHIPSNILYEWWKEVVEYRTIHESQGAGMGMQLWGSSADTMSLFSEHHSVQGWKKYALKALQRKILLYDNQPECNNVQESVALCNIQDVPLNRIFP